MEQNKFNRTIRVDPALWFAFRTYCLGQRMSAKEEVGNLIFKKLKEVGKLDLIKKQKELAKI